MRSRRTKPARTIRWIAVLGLSGLVAAACVGGSESSDQPMTVFEENFAGTEYVFWTGSDGDVGSEVVDGVLRFQVVDASQTQTLRVVLPDALYALRAEATVTLESHQNGVFGMGCWSADRSYLAVITGDRFVGVMEARDIPGGDNRDIEVLMEMTRTPLVEPATTANRVRVDCVSGEDGGWLAVWMNGVAIGSVPIPSDVDGFDAVGFTATTDFEGATYSIDDVVVVAENLAPPDESTTLAAFAEDAAATTWFERDGIRFAFPDDWAYYDVGGTPFDVPGSWSFAISPDPEMGFIALHYMPEDILSGIALGLEEFVDAYIDFEVSQGLAVRDGPDFVTIGGLPGFTVAVDGVVGSKTGRPLLAEQAFVFGETETYLLVVSYPESAEEGMLPAWTDVLASFET